MKALVSYELDANVASITMNDGKVDVMTLAMLQALDRAIDQARSDNAMIVLRSGLSRIFSAGFDIKLFAAGDAMLAGFVDRVVAPDEIDRSAGAIVLQLKSIDHQAHHQTKLRLREPTFAAMRAAIDAELTIEAYRARRG